MGTVGLTLDLVTDDAARAQIGSFTKNGNIANNAIFGSGFWGDFFGPKANEFGAVWSLVDDPPGGRTQLIGVAVGKRD